MRAYPPVEPDGYCRLRSVEGGTRRDTSARSQAVAVPRAAEVERQGLVPTWPGPKEPSWWPATWTQPDRLPGGRPWSERHREEQEAYCRRFVLPVIGALAWGGGTSSRRGTGPPRPRWPPICGAVCRSWSPPGWRRATCWCAKTCCRGALASPRRRGGRPRRGRGDRPGGEGSRDPERGGGARPRPGRGRTAGMWWRELEVLAAYRSCAGASTSPLPGALRRRGAGRCRRAWGGSSDSGERRFVGRATPTTPSRRKPRETERRSCVLDVSRNRERAAAR